MPGTPPRLVILTGPGLARESGFAPFDAAAMPAGTTLEDVLTRDGFERNPAKVQDFYNRCRRELLDRVKPNPAHDALAVLSTALKGGVLIVTRNIDDLHERAGSDPVLHTHGELLKARCAICTHVGPRLDDITPDSQCPTCGNTGHLRPHIVRVGEEPQHIPLIIEALAHCQTFAAIGAGGGELVKSFVAEAQRAGVRIAKIDNAPLTETVPEWVRKMV